MFSQSIPIVSSFPPGLPLLLIQNTMPCLFSSPSSIYSCLCNILRWTNTGQLWYHDSSPDTVYIMSSILIYHPILPRKLKTWMVWYRPVNLNFFVSFHLILLQYSISSFIQYSKLVQFLSGFSLSSDRGTNSNSQSFSVYGFMYMAQSIHICHWCFVYRSLIFSCLF